MKIECPKCHRKYDVEDAYIPIGGAPIKCPNCGNIFGIYVEPIDIPMTPIEDDSGSAVEEAVQTAPEAAQQAPNTISPPEQDSNELAKTNPMIDHSFGMGDAEETPESPDLGALGTLGQQDETSTPEQASPDLGSMMSEQPEQSPDLGSFGQQETPSPDIGAFGAQSQPEEPLPPEETVSSDLGAIGAQTETTPEADTNTPELGAMMQDQVSETPDLGGFGQQDTAPSPDLGAFGTQPQQEAQQSMPEAPSPDLGAMMQNQVPDAQDTPDLGGFGQQETAPSPDLNTFVAQPQPEVQQPANEEHPSVNIPTQPETVPEPEAPTDAAAAKRKVGGTLFESLLAGFTLPSNFKSLPENVQKNHKSAVKLARQLAKDILLYHKDEVERGLQNGNIKDILKDEIEKSFKFYSQRVEPDILENSNYFTEALNKIIAKGNQLF